MQKRDILAHDFQERKEEIEEELDLLSENRNPNPDNNFASEKTSDEVDEAFNQALDSLSEFKEYRAVKVFPKSFIDKEEEVEKFKSEVRVMWELNSGEDGSHTSKGGHPNLIKFYHYFDEPKRYLIV